VPRVQFWQAENGGRLDRSHRERRRSNIPGLVDASDVRTVNALETRQWVSECNRDVSPMV
jgi:hypothetical protein